MGLVWASPGPIAAAFEQSSALNPIIIGPVGSGKTTTAIRKAIGLARRVPGMEQTVQRVARPVKRCRIAIVSRTYRILWKNVVPSYWKVFPKEWGKWNGGDQEPFVHRFQVDMGDAVLDLQFDGLAVGDTSLDDLTRGLELTGAYIYEFDTLPPETITKFLSRCGRYPAMGNGALQDQVPRQVFCDANAFDPDHWAYPECFDSPPPGRTVFVQPGGRAPNAENVQNVGRRYYDDLCAVLKPWEIARLVDNRFVPDRPGFLVYPDWNPQLHMAPGALEAAQGVPLIVGVDPGLKAAAAVLQRPRKGVWRCLAELTTPVDRIATAEQFAGDLADMIKQRWPRAAVLAVLDPAAQNRSADTGRAWMQAFAAAWPYPWRLAASQRVKGPNGRISAVRDVLCHLSDGQPGYLLDPGCKVLAKGFNGAYRLRPRPGQDGVASDEIEKTPESHVHDAQQYAIQTIEADPAAMGRAEGAAAPAPGRAAPPMQILM
jgi:hypothetical protein